MMFGGKAATEMLRSTEQQRKVARLRSEQHRAQDEFLSLVTAQGVIRRYVSDPEMAVIADRSRLPNVGKGYTDAAIRRALPEDHRREVDRHMMTTPRATSLKNLAKPKWVVDRSKLKFGKDKTSFFGAYDV